MENNSQRKLRRKGVDGKQGKERNKKGRKKGRQEEPKKEREEGKNVGVRWSQHCQVTCRDSSLTAYAIAVESS
jgi:hypothetical protein